MSNARCPKPRRYHSTCQELVENRWVEDIAIRIDRVDNWDCGPADNGGEGGQTFTYQWVDLRDPQWQSRGIGACVGCQGDGCFNGDPGDRDGEF